MIIQSPVAIEMRFLKCYLLKIGGNRVKIAESFLKCLGVLGEKADGYILLSQV
jgi:hypothetical protein